MTDPINGGYMRVPLTATYREITLWSERQDFFGSPMLKSTQVAFLFGVGF